MNTTVSTPRQQRIDHLVSARARIDAEIRRLVNGDRHLARLARDLVWDGNTHAQAAEALGLRPVEVRSLLERLAVEG